MTGGEYRDDSPEVYKAVVIDSLAKRYAKLPSEIIANATTIDLQILDLAVSYDNHKQKKKDGPQELNLSEEEMMAALNKVRD